MNKIVLPELVSAGIYNAQIAHKNRSVSPNRKTTMFEIELPIGSGGISYIDDTMHPIEESLIICAKPGQMRHTRLPFKCYYIHMIVNEGRLFDSLSALPNYMEQDEVNDIRDIFIELCSRYASGSAKEDIMLQSLILKLIHILEQSAPTFEIAYNPKHNNHAVIEQTLQYIKEHLAADLSLEVLSAQATFSPVYFHKLFKASTGKNLREYVEEQRIKKAIALLLSTEMTLAQIAYECGFSSQSYFSYTFKRHTGTTPRGYAKQIVEQYHHPAT